MDINDIVKWVFSVLVQNHQEMVISWDISWDISWEYTSGKLTVCYGKSQCSTAKSTISMAMFNSYANCQMVFDFLIFYPHHTYTPLEWEYGYPHNIDVLTCEYLHQLILTYPLHIQKLLTFSPNEYLIHWS
jgi:hypothetical protein